MSGTSPWMSPGGFLCPALRSIRTTTPAQAYWRLRGAAPAKPGSWPRPHLSRRPSHGETAPCRWTPGHGSDPLARQLTGAKPGAIHCADARCSPASEATSESPRLRWRRRRRRILAAMVTFRARQQPKGSAEALATEKAVLHGVESCGGPGRYADPGVDVLDVMLGGSWRHE